MSRDVLLYGLSQSVPAAQLLQWRETTPGLHDFPAPDFHRLQLEHWIWSHRAVLGPAVLDVGVYTPRRYLGDGYITVGEHDEDIRGSLLALPFQDDTFDGVVLTEVLEHCTDPVGAVNQVRRVLKPGGLLLVTSPFVWPEHDVAGQYRDYWRFTRHGWELLLGAFTDVTITPCAWTDEGAAAYDVMRRFECFGFASQTQATTGYLCEARKPA
jgi:Methylase involved in ubiquinone/menaquinone biosynthesis